MTKNTKNHFAAKIKLNHVLFLITVLVAVVLFFWTYPQYFCGGSLSFKLSKSALVAKADSLLAEIGYHEPGGIAKISAVCDEELYDQLRLFVELARNIQRLLLPKELFSIKSFTFESIFIPSEQVGGDTYDFIHLEDGKFADYVFDVSGHGMAAALLASHI